MRDKFYHVLAGAFFAFVIGCPVYASSHDLFAGLWSCLVGVIVGGVKEWCDMRTKGNEWDWADFGFTALGACILMLVVLGMHYGRG